jgi:hypothetical protein
MEIWFTMPSNNPVRVGAIAALTLATAYIHLTLGGLLFTLNGVGYLVLVAAVVLTAVAPRPAARRFAWLPRLGLAGYAGVTIVGYLVLGPHFLLGWVTKAIELVLVGLIGVDLLITYRGPSGLLREAVRSLGLERRFS